MTFCKLSVDLKVQMKSLGLPLLRSVIVFDGRDELRNAAKYPAARSVGGLVAEETLESASWWCHLDLDTTLDKTRVGGDRLRCIT